MKTFILIIVSIVIITYMLSFGAYGIIKYMVANNVERLDTLKWDGIRLFLINILYSPFALGIEAAKKVADSLNWTDNKLKNE